MNPEALLRSLPAGRVMWLKASGNSLWPVLRDGDSLLVERVHGDSFRLGDVAVVQLRHGVLAAHIVVSLAPLETASMAGVRDALPLEGLGKVTEYQRSGVRRRLAPTVRYALRWLPDVMRLGKRLSPLRKLIRFVRD